MTNDPVLSEAFTILDQAMRRQRQAMEAVRFRLLEARLVMDAEEARFVPHVMHDVEDALRRLRSTADGTLEVDVPTSWWSLLDDAPEPWSTVFSDHRRALGQACTEIADALQDPHLSGVLDPHVWAEVAGEPVGADPQPTDDLNAVADEAARRLDAVVCRGAVAALSPKRRRSLVDFLG